MQPIDFIGSECISSERAKEREGGRINQPPLDAVRWVPPFTITIITIIIIIIIIINNISLVFLRPASLRFASHEDSDS